MTLNFFKKISSMIYLLLCDRNGNLAYNHRFLLHRKCKPADKTLKQRFQKAFKATCENCGESELKQQNTI